MIITIDGLDGSGKSTLARNLSAYYDYVFMDKPISHFYNQFIPLNKQIIEKMQENISSINSDFLNAYYSTLSLVYFQKTMKNQNVILNGGLLTSYLESGNSNTKELYETLIKQGLLFDLSILLYCDRDERLNRLRKKSNSDTYLMNQSLNNFSYDETFNLIKEHPDKNILIIDTTHLSMDEIFEVAKNEIEKIKNNKVLRK